MKNKKIGLRYSLDSEGNEKNAELEKFLRGNSGGV